MEIGVLDVPGLQRLVVGALVNEVVLAEPHLAATLGNGAAHEAVVPPFTPAQLQFQGPVPVSAEAVPVEQRPVVGAPVVATPLAAPQAPLVTASFGAVQDAVVPPPVPAQLQFQGPSCSFPSNHWI
jgi:hypothetical protein